MEIYSHICKSRQFEHRILVITKLLHVLFQRPASSSSAAMAMRMQGASGMHPYGPNVPRAGLVPGAAAALEQARRRQDAKNRRRFNKTFLQLFLIQKISEGKVPVRSL